MTVEIHCCPRCDSEEVSRNGQTRHRKQNYKCRECGRQFVLNPTWKAITKEQQELMSRMLLERISQAGIARVLQLSSGGDKRPRTFTGKCFRALDPPQKFRLIDKIISRVKKYPVVIKKKGLANTTRPKSIICYPHSIIPYSKNI